tara:strand:- start:311 stop:526 length:216 start_codon:yes stop_codon:yes gene_type:complete
MNALACNGVDVRRGIPMVACAPEMIGSKGIDVDIEKTHTLFLVAKLFDDELAVSYRVEDISPRDCSGPSIG